MKNKWLSAAFCAVLASFLLGVLLLPDEAVSETERRTLRQFPVPTVRTVWSGDWAERLDAWLPDQFPLREPLRRVAMRFRTNVLMQRDYNGVYTVDGHAAKTVYPLDEMAVARLGARVDALAAAYFPENSVYCALIPDKGTYLARGSGHLSLDFAAMETLFFANCTHATYIGVSDLLSASDYYDTDIHWRQECLSPVAERLLARMGVPLPETAYERHTLTPFYGSYYAQSIGATPDTLTYLVSDVTEQARAENLQKPAVTSVYDVAAFSGMDGYDVFLSGATPLVTLKNGAPADSAKSRTLLLFRDSFGSSLAPLLLPAYETIVLIDLRYLSETLLPDILSEFNTKTADVLFLYGMQTANTRGILR